jgi:hypothetical protein
MSLLEQQNLLARLYTDEQFRRDFLNEPLKIGAENNLNEAEIVELTKVMPEELNFFSESLFVKRLREVEKLLPLTHKVLTKDFQTNFREFTNNYNPQSVKKHLEDAIEFCKYLQTKQIETKDAAKFEQAKLEVFGYGKSFKFVMLNHNIETFEPKKGFAMWIKAGKTVKFFNR